MWDINTIPLNESELRLRYVYVVVQLYHRFNFYFPLLLGMVMYDNDYTTKGNKNRTKDKFEPQLI